MVEVNLINILHYTGEYNGPFTLRQDEFEKLGTTSVRRQYLAEHIAKACHFTFVTKDGRLDFVPEEAAMPDLLKLALNMNGGLRFEGPKV